MGKNDTEEKKKINNVNQRALSFALHDILDEYPEIKKERINFFAPVYYPIAIVEMEVQEKSFEDFELVQISVLRMMAAGLTDISVISKTMGLSAKYVSEMRKLLYGYGHIDENNRVTQTGMESLSIGQKVTEVNVVQRYQVDVYSGEILNLSEKINETSIDDLENTSFYVGHLESPEMLSRTRLIEQIRKANQDGEYRLYRKSYSPLNINATNIDPDSVRFVELQYAASYMLSVEGWSFPVVFSKRFNAVPDSGKRFITMPLYATSKEQIMRYSFPKDIPVMNITVPAPGEIYTAHPMARLYEMIRNEWIRRAERFDISHIFGDFSPIDCNSVRFSGVNNGVIEGLITRDSFRDFSLGVLDVLRELKKYGRYYVADKELFGNIIVLLTRDAEILELSFLLWEKENQLVIKEMKRHGSEQGEEEKYRKNAERKLSKYLQSRFKNIEEENKNVIDILSEILSEDIDIEKALASEE